MKKKIVISISLTPSLVKDSELYIIGLVNYTLRVVKRAKKTKDG